MNNKYNNKHDSKYYVYRFINKEGIILYVGKTTNLDNRIYVHINEGHLPSSCYKYVHQVQYLVFNTKVDMDIAELYYINKFKPMYNSLDKEVKPLEIEFQNDFKWLPYEKLDFQAMYAYRYKVQQLEAQYKDISAKYAKMLTVSPNQIKIPYSLTNIEADLAYISKVIGKKIAPIRNTVGMFFFYEAIEVLKSYPDLSLRSCNPDTNILLTYSQNPSPHVLASDTTLSIVEKNPTCRFYLDCHHESPEYVSNNFILEGVVPLLYYKIVKS